MTPLLIIGIIVAVIVVLFALSLAKTAARADRMAQRQRQDLLLRYTGGDPLCVVCGQPSMYSLNGTPVHPECRVTLEARNGRGAAA